MTLQRLKTLNRSALALIITGLAIAGGSFYYTVGQLGRKSIEPVLRL